MKIFSALIVSFLSAAVLTESITTTITATKNGHVYTKTITQDATFVWQGEGSYGSSGSSEATKPSSTEVTSSSSAAPSSSIISSSIIASSATVAPSSSSTPSSDSGSGSSITTTITATKNGHVYTKTVTQDATFVWQGEGSSSATTSAATSDASSQTSAIASYTGGAGALTVGSGMMGAAVAAAFLIWGDSNS